MNISLGQEILAEADHIEDPYPKSIRIMPVGLGMNPLMKLLKRKVRYEEGLSRYGYCY